VVLAGVIQIGLGLARAGFIAAYFPTSVIKGLLAAIGTLLILKQIPHLFGRDSDPAGEMSFIQPDNQNTFSEIINTITDIHPAATVIGLASIALLVSWERFKPLKKTGIPAPLLVVLAGVGLSQLFARMGSGWVIEGSHLVQVPVAESLGGFLGFLQFPDFSQWTNPAIYVGAVTIALVASLETLLNLEAVDRIDPQQRTSPRSHELVAQGVGNVTSGLLGGLPVTSVIVRSSVNINAGGQTKLSAIVHGFLLLFCAMLLPTWLNMIPLSSLAAILLVTGFKLASPKLVKQMWAEGRYQFIPFVVTVLAIVFTDLLIGILIGLAVSMSFILNSNLRRPIRRIVEKHMGGDVLRIELAEQVSFLKRAALSEVLNSVPRGGHVLLDARGTDFIDPDVLDLIRDFKEESAPARGVHVSLKGFRTKYDLADHIQYVDYATRDLQSAMTPDQVLELLLEGHRRFRSGERLNRDLARQVDATANGQHPLAVVVSCIDSRAPAELIFDAGVGDIFSVRVAGNVIRQSVMGSVEYACAVAGAKLVLVMGHTRCGAVTAAVQHASQLVPTEDPECRHVQPILNDIMKSMDVDRLRSGPELSESEQEAVVNQVSHDNVARTVVQIVAQSKAIARLVREGKVAVVGAMYDVTSGDLEIVEAMRDQAASKARQLSVA
jgi:carbonic anhydrase/SulP family sulfate permease